MGFLPNVLHDNSGSISINQVNKFYGYNHNKVISDSEFFDMENMCGDDFPALSVRNGRSLYHWNEIKASYLDTIRVLYCKMYEAIYRILLTLPNSSVADMTFEEYLKSKNLEYLLDNNLYQTHLAGNESEFLETYFNGNYNGSIDFDGLFIVMGSYVYYKSMVICEVADNKKVIVPIGEKIAIFPDKIIVDINKAKTISEDLSTNINEIPDEYQTGSVLSDYFAWNLKMFAPCVSPIDAEHNYVGTGDNSPSGNLLKNPDFVGIDFSLSQTHINKEDIALDEVWYVRPYINRSESLIIQSVEDSEKGNCLKVELSQGNIHGLYQKVKYSSGGKMNLKLTFYAKANERIIIKPYISIGSVKSNIGRSFWVDTEWTEICIEENVIVPESGEFIVSLDGRSLGGTVIFSSPKCERVFSDAEIACNVEMSHYTLSGHIMSDNLLMSTDFSDVEDKELSGFSSTDDLDEVWKISCSVGKNTTLKTIFAISGADYSKLYISMLDSKNIPFLFVYDANTGFWYKEDALRASGFVFCENKLRLIEEGSGDLITLDDPASNEYIRWFFESGDLYDSTSYKKYIWRLFLRIGMHRSSKIKIYLQYNSNGVWELQKELESSGRKTFSIPLQCQRTDHLKLRIEGCGKITIYSLARRFIVASDI